PCTRAALAIEAATSRPGDRVVRVLDRIAGERGLPARLVLANDPELTGKALAQWAYHHGAALRFSDPGTPIQNAGCESCNGRFRDECLNEHWVRGLADARRLIEAWRHDDHQHRPHGALGYQTPAAVGRHLRAAAPALPRLTGLSSSVDQTMGAGHRYSKPRMKLARPAQMSRTI
ncbi:MAG: integrase core domain-containing protein, partial [Thermomicrobiales bacterium]